MKQTAVEFFEKELIKRFKRSDAHRTDSEWCFNMIKKVSKKAKEIEKQNIINAYNGDVINTSLLVRMSFINGISVGEQYYNETFKQEEK